MRTQIGTKSSDGEHSNTERAEAADVGKASSVRDESGDVVASKNSKKGGALKEAEIGVLIEKGIAIFERSWISIKFKNANGSDKIQWSHD